MATINAKCPKKTNEQAPLAMAHAKKQFACSVSQRNGCIHSRVKRTTSEKDTHFPTNFCNTLTETVLPCKISATKARKLACLRGIFEKSARENWPKTQVWDNLTRYQNRFRQIQKISQMDKKDTTRNKLDFAAKNDARQHPPRVTRLPVLMGRVIGHCGDHQYTMNTVHESNGGNETPPTP